MNQNRLNLITLTLACNLNLHTMALSKKPYK
jgi:hypothetical protein